MKFVSILYHTFKYGFQNNHTAFLIQIRASILFLACGITLIYRHGSCIDVAMQPYAE